jgi:N-acetylglucosamine-6-phosphate deacetylase
LSQTLPKIKDRFIITNDAVAAAGLGEGKFSFGDINVVAKDGQARSIEGKLAGGIANITDSIKRLATLGISNEIAVASATTRPCELIGVSYESVINHFD